MGSCEKKKLNDVEGERDSLKTKSGKSDQTNQRQLEKKRKLKTNNKQVKEERNDTIEPNKTMVEQIQKLEAEKKELEMTLNGQTDLKTENKELSTQIERLTKKANNSEFECKRLQEELKTYINYQSRKYTKELFKDNIDFLSLANPFQSKVVQPCAISIYVSAILV